MSHADVSIPLSCKISQVHPNLLRSVVRQPIIIRLSFNQIKHNNRPNGKIPIFVCLAFDQPRRPIHDVAERKDLAGLQRELHDNPGDVNAKDDSGRGTVCSAGFVFCFLL